MERCIERETIRWFRRRIRTWADVNRRDFPWRHTVDPYRLLVAELLLQQTDAPRVVPVYLRFMESYPSVGSLAEAPACDVAALLRPLGLHYRASRLQRAAQIIMSDPVYGCSIPADESLLLKLPGVGRYVARSVCAQAYDMPLATLDTNIGRILERFFGLERQHPRLRDDPYFWECAERVAPRKNVALWNMALVDFGALVCRWRDPLHDVCPLERHCGFYLRVGQADVIQPPSD